MELGASFFVRPRLERSLFSLSNPEEGKTSTKSIPQTLVEAPGKTTNVSIQNSFSTQNGTEDVSLTIVTAYIDIGTIRKAKNAFWRSPEVYLQWAKIFEHIRNPLVVYTDSEYFLRLIQTYRARFPERTKLILFDKSSSWAFSLNSTIKKIYIRKEYPDYIYQMPTAVNYSCVQHAKYEVTQRAAKENYFGTDYIAWLDVGLFRESVNNSKDFILALPPDFNDSKLAVNQVNNVSMDVEFWPIFKRKLVWICGCSFVGRINTVIRYTEQYKRSVEYFMSQNLMNTDEQIVYATYVNTGRKELKPEIDLQLYMKPIDYTGIHWFYIGYIMRIFV